jgi:hypothetical protein
MKLIATRDFRNVGHRIQVENVQHPDHVPRGATFELGAAADLKALKKEDRELGYFAAMLVMSGVADAPTPEIIARIEAENEVARKREARAVQADEVCRLENVGAIVAALGLAAKKLKT